MRNSNARHMNYRERAAYRAERSKAIAGEKNAKQETLNRLKDMVIAIEDAVKPEADALHAKIIKSWQSALAYVVEHMDAANLVNSVRKAYTGVDVDAMPQYKGQKYVNKMGYGTYTPEYVIWLDATEVYRKAKERFNGTKMDIIIARRLLTREKLLGYAIKDADETVEANKYKLLNGVAQYMGEYQTVEVIGHNVIPGAKGFPGYFGLNTDKGPRLFTCKAITAEGPVVSFHWRYIIHIKTV